MSQRLTFLAPAPTGAQRHLRFPADDPIEPLAPGTAAAVAAALGRVAAAVHAPDRPAVETTDAAGLGATAEPRLAGWSCGAWRGRRVEDVARDEPDAFGAWRCDPGFVPPGGDESLADVIARVGSWLAGLPGGDADGDARPRVVAVADAAVVRAALVAILGADPEVFWRFDVPPLSLTVAQRAAGPWQLRCVGCAVTPSR
jgi:broad specificity phosphatase PhoE